MLPTPKSLTFANGVLRVNSKVAVSCKDEKLLPAIEFFENSLNAIYGIGCDETNENADIELVGGEMSSESYELNVTEYKAIIKASDLRGAIYAISTFLQLIRSDEGGLYIQCASICDSPYTEIRGVHFYMPERSKIADFKKLIDFMAFLKMNTVILEVGGGMEYERHPEINEAWVKFCQTINKFPGLNGYKSFQGSDFYWKDSLHTELCGGSFLTKREVKDIVDYCKMRGMDVIPEIQALSHCYYLTVAHPEIAELEDDPFPDTYCPNNEKSYELYFDVAEEVIEVFEPKTVSIGHDEIRVLGWCDKCKDKSGHELVGKDIKRLYDFYKARGIRITMWAESAQTFENYLGAQIGSEDR